MINQIEIDDIIECKNCGLFLHKQEYSKKHHQKCPRCNSKLPIESKHSIDSLFYAISAIMLFLIINIYPIIDLSFFSKHLNTTLIDTVFALFEGDMFFVAVIVFFTIVLMPLLNSLIILIYFFQRYTKLKILTDTFLHDSFHFTQTWAFIEVFILSIIVTYIKLTGMVSSTKFDIGFYSLLAYIICFYMSNKKFESKSVFGD